MAEADDETKAAEPASSWQLSAYPQAPMGAQGLAVVINLLVVGWMRLAGWMRNQFRLAQERRRSGK